MKKSKFPGGLLAIALFSLLLIGCSDNDALTSESPTEEIRKIETSYVEGVYKPEGDVPGSKTETSLPSALIERSKNEILRLINTEMANRKYTHASARELFAGYDVGMIPYSGNCPAWSETVEFYMDCEDNNPTTSMIPAPGNTTPFPHTPQVDGNKNLRLRFCRLDGRVNLAPVMTYNSSTGQYQNYSYAVLKLGTMSIPSSSRLMIRSFDNEDRNNKNSRFGDIAPNVSNSNTTLHFHIIDGNLSTVDPTTPNTGLPFSVPTGYGVFGGRFNGPPTSDPGYTNWTSVPYEWRINVDDEDNDNANWCTVNGVNTTTPFPSFSATSNTSFTTVFGYFVGY